jgi:hypothetical protein
VRNNNKPRNFWKVFAIKAREQWWTSLVFLRLRRLRQAHRELTPLRINWMVLYDISKPAPVFTITAIQ